MTGAGTDDTPCPSRLADRLLAALVCVREEAAGHPADVPAADAAARQAGGDFARRIRARAAALPEAPALRKAIQQVLGRGLGLLLLVVALAGFSGAFAAAAALDAGPPASLPLVLLLLVGSNLLMLLVWLLGVPLSRRVTPGLGRCAMTLWQRFAGGRAGIDAGDDPRRTVLGILVGGASGRWLAASLGHAAWLSFALGAWLSLLIFLSVRAYALSWDTTLLAPATVAAWVHGLSFGPAALGAPVDHLFAGTAGQTVAGQAGAQWLLAAALAYGVLPRLLALLCCGGLWWRAQARFGRDLQRSGYARLRRRLMPDRVLLGVTDTALAPPPAAPPSPPEAATAHAVPWPSGPVLGLWLDDAGDRRPPALPNVHWHGLGATDTAAARTAARAAVAAHPQRPVLVLARATMSPDRGAERFMAQLRSLTAAPVQLVLIDMDRLVARGPAPCRQRLADWQTLALRAGLEHRPLQWPEGLA